MNHSCEPNVAFDLSSSEISNWHIRALKPIAAGEPRKLNPFKSCSAVDLASSKLLSFTRAQSGIWIKHSRASVAHLSVDDSIGSLLVADAGTDLPGSHPRSEISYD